MKNLYITVIVSTYNSEDWLRKVLEGYKHQTYDFFEVIVVDDGSKETTKDLIDSFKLDYPVTLRHIWHEDKGYRRQRILNIAITKANHDYILFTDGDCIPRNDFVAVHHQKRVPNFFLSGGYFKLPKTISDLITESDIEAQACFDPKWLLYLGLKKTFKLNKLCSKGRKELLLNKYTVTKATWNGMNSSAWKQDIMAVNGLIPECNMGERIANLGNV